MTVIVSAQVKEFLTHERNYLRKHSAAAHKRLALRMREAARLCPSFRWERNLHCRSMRSVVVVDDYVLDYEVAGGKIHILHMRHGRQRDPYLEPEDNVDYEAD